MLELIERYEVSSLEAHILEYLLRRASKSGWVHNVTCGQIAKKLRVSGSTIRRHLKKLEERGLIARKTLRASDGRTFLTLQVKIDRLKYNEEFVDTYKQQQQTNNNGVQIDRGEESKPLSEKEKEAVRLMVQNELRLRRIPLHKAVFFLINSKDMERTLRDLERFDSDPSIKNPVGLMVVRSRVRKEAALRWEWLVSDDGAVPEELEEYARECEKELREELDREVKQEQAHEILALCEIHGIEPPWSYEELLQKSQDELFECKKKAIILAGKKILRENRELALLMRKKYGGILKSDRPRDMKEYVFYSIVLEEVRKLVV